MAIIDITQYDECERPVCPTLGTLEFVEVPSPICHLETASVAWHIVGTNVIPTLTEVVYAINSDNLSNTVNSATNTGTYSPGDKLYSLIPFPGVAGILRIQARAIIGGIIHTSDVLSIIVNECDARCFPGWKVDPSSPGDMITDLYLEWGTWWVPDRIQILGNYDAATCTGNVLYDTNCASTLDRNDTFPGAYPPTQWNPNLELYPDDGALYLNSRDKLAGKPPHTVTGIWHDCIQIHQSDLPLGIKTVPNCYRPGGTIYTIFVLGPDFELFQYANSRDQNPDCDEIPTRTGTIDYTTYYVRDHLYIYSGQQGNPCDVPPGDRKVLWTSGCVGTSRGEGPGSPYGSKYAGGKVDTFNYADSDLPLYVDIAPNCENTTGTAWCATVYLSEPGGIHWEDCGGDPPCCGQTNCNTTTTTTTTSTTTTSTTTTSTTTTSTSTTTTSTSTTTTSTSTTTTSTSTTTTSTSTTTTSTSTTTTSTSTTTTSTTTTSTSTTTTSTSTTTTSTSTTTTSTSTTTTSTSTTTTSDPYYALIPIPFSMLATEDERNLTYEEFINKKVDEFYEENPTIFDGKTDEEKEDIILDLVGEGRLFADVAIGIAVREGLET